MKKISLLEAIEILQNAAGVIINDAIGYPSVTGDDEEFLFFKICDDEGLEYEYSFLADDNQEIEVVGACLMLKDSSGEIEAITILVANKLF